MSRNFGLDVVRGAAITFVVICHLGYAWLPGYAAYGHVAVEAFFALSGFLVAQMIAERFGELACWSYLPSFYANRWLRTLPLYLLGLVLFTYVANAHHVPAPPRLPYLTFTQNFLQGGVALYHNAYGISWSLAIEEWFYLGLPLALLALPPMPFARKIGILAAGVIVASLAARGWRSFETPGLEYDDMFRRTATLRMDSFMFGALAYCWTTWRTRTRAADWVAAAAGAAVLAAGCWAILADLLETDVCKVLLPSALPLSTALMLPLVSRATAGSIATAAVRFLSTRTFAIYIVHLPIIDLCARHGVDPLSWQGGLVILSILVAANALYFVVERPIMRLRPIGVRPISIPRARTRQAEG